MLGLCMTVRQRPSPQKNHSMTTKPQMKRTRISPEFHVGRAALLATAAVAGFHASPVSAAVIDKADNTNNLNLPASWTGGVVPGAADIARWNGLAGANSVLLGADMSLQGLTIATTGGAVSIGGSNTLTLGVSGIDMSAASQNLAITSNLALGTGTQVWNVAASRTLSLSGGTFTRAVGATLNLQGTGTVTSTMSGLANVNGILGPWATIGTGTSTRFAALSGSDVVPYTAGTAVAWNGTLNSETTNYEVSAALDTVYGGSQRKANTIRYTGTGVSNVTLGNSPNGNGLLTNGILNAGTATLNFGTAGSGTAGLVIGANAELVLNAANAGIYITAAIHNKGTIAGTPTFGTDASAVTIAAAGLNSVTLGGANTYTGTTTVGSGTLIAISAAALGTNAAGTTVASGATLDVRADIGTEALTVGGTGVGGNGALIAAVGTGTVGGTVTLTENTSVGGSATLNLNGVIGDGGGARGLTKVGAGVTSLNAANTYTGATTISEGTLQLGNGGTTGALATSSTITNNGSLVFNRSNTVTQGTDFSGSAITGTGSVTKLGTGTLILNTANTYAGTTTLGVASGTDGILRIAHNNALGTTAGGTAITGNSQNGRLELSGNITVTGETLTISGRQGTAAAAAALSNFSGNNTWTGDVNFNTGGSEYNIESQAGTLTISGQISGASLSGARNLNLQGAGNGEVSGNIVNGSGGATVSATKTGAGTWTLSGTKGYTGNTTVSQGTLLINGSISTSVLTTVQTGATLGGSGTVGALTVQSGGILAPGTSPGNLTVSNGLTLGGILSWELAALSTSNPGTDFDTVTVTAGNVDLTGASLGLNLGAYAPTAIPFWQTAQTWSGILNNTGLGSLTGAFTITTDQTPWASLGSFSNTYTGNDVNLVWTPVPEPRAATLAGALLAAGLLRRRRCPA